MFKTFGQPLEWVNPSPRSISFQKVITLYYSNDGNVPIGSHLSSFFSKDFSA